MTQDDQDYTAHLTLTGSPDAAFAALTTLAGLDAWWTEVTGDAGPGGELRFTFGDESQAAVMRVDAASPERVVWTCLSCHVTDWVATTITFDISPGTDQGCELSFRHHGLTPQLECFLDCQQGWNYFLTSLQSLVDTGIGHPRTSAAASTRHAQAV